MILVQGGNEPFISSSARLVKWMEEENMAPDWLVRLDWELDYNATTMGQQIADSVGEVVESFTMNKTKAELYHEGAILRKILIAPVSTAKDICEDLQLEARNYWKEIYHDELEESIVYCGPFIRMSETPIKYQMRAPLIGEYNDGIYRHELGISRKKYDFLKERDVI
jgi:crotonobetainyl-CoA:carnitine CoA-transferase CaiB-like acyl-CoA transferase